MVKRFNQEAEEGQSCQDHAGCINDKANPGKLSAVHVPDVHLVLTNDLAKKDINQVRRRQRK